MLCPVQHAAWHIGPMLAWLIAFSASVCRSIVPTNVVCTGACEAVARISLSRAAPCPLYKVLCQQGPVLLQVLNLTNIPSSSWFRSCNVAQQDAVITQDEACAARRELHCIQVASHAVGGPVPLPGLPEVLCFQQRAAAPHCISLLAVGLEPTSHAAYISLP